MKRAIIFFSLCLLLSGIGAGLASLKAQEEVTDSLSIDDMPPVLYQEEEEEESEESNTGVYVAIGIAGVVAVGIGVMAAKKKK